MSAPFIEQNIFLPGTPEEQEDQKRTWEEILADDVAAQTAPVPPPPPPPPVGLTPGAPSDTLAPAPPPAPPPVGLTPAAPSDTLTPPPPPDPLEQALGGLDQTIADIQFQEQNTQLPPFTPDPWGDFEPLIGAELDQIATDIYTPDQSFIDRRDFFDQAISDWNDFGILPPEFNSVQELQVALDVFNMEADQALEEADRELVIQDNALTSSFLLNLPEYQANLQDPNVRGAPSREQAFGPYVPPPATPYAQGIGGDIQPSTGIEPALLQAMQQEQLQRLGAQGLGGELQITGPDPANPAEVANFNLFNDQRVTNRNRDIEALMRAETDPARIEALREQYVNVPDGGRPYVGKDGVVRYSPFFETVYPGVGENNPFRFAGEVAASGGPGVLLTPATVPLGFLGVGLGAGLEGAQKLDAYISGSSIGSIYNDIFTSRVREISKRELVRIADIPRSVQADMYHGFNTLREEGPGGFLADRIDRYQRLFGVATDPRSALNPLGALETAAFGGDAQKEAMVEQYRAEVPLWAQLTGELAIAIFGDPANLVTPLTWVKGARAGRQARVAQRSVAQLVDDATRTGTVADTEVMNGIAIRLNNPQSVTDAARMSYAQDVLRRDIGVRATGDPGLVGEFSQRANYRILASESEDQWGQIVLEELGRAREKGLRVTGKNPDPAIRAAVQDIGDAYRRRGQDFWDYAYRDGYPDEVAARADAAWRDQLDRVHTPDVKWTPLDGLDFRLTDLMRWGHGPEALYNGTWYSSIQVSRALSAGETPFMGEIITRNTPVTNSEQDFLRRQFDEANRSDEYVTPQTMGEVWQLTHRLYGRDDIPMPRGMVASNIVNAPGYTTLDASARISNPQLSLLEWRSRLSGANLFDEVATHSPDNLAFTRGRADEVLNAAPALESQKAQLRSLRDQVQPAKGRRDGQFVNANRITGLTDTGIERLTFNDAQEIIQRAFSPAEVTDQFIYSLPLGDILSNKRWTQEQAFRAQSALVLDDMLISRGKGRQPGVRRGPNKKFDGGIWTHTHSLRADPIYIADFFSKLVAVEHPILRNPDFGGLVRSVGAPAKRDMMSPSILREIEDALDDIPRIVAQASTKNISEFTRLVSNFYEKGMTLNGVEIKPPLRVHRSRGGVSSFFLDAANITDEVRLGRASNDLAMRRMAYTNAKNHLDEHRAILHSVGIDEADFGRMLPDDAQRALLEAARNYSGGEASFRKLARELLGERQFRVDGFVNTFRSLRNQSDELLRQIRQQEQAISEGLQNIDGANTLLDEIPPFRPVDQIREFAAQFGLPYGGMSQRPPVLNELHMRFGGPEVRARLKDNFESRSIIHTSQEYRRTLMESSVETAYALTKARGGQGPAVSFDPVKKYKPPQEAARETAANNFVFFKSANDRKVRSLLDGRLAAAPLVGKGSVAQRLGRRVRNALTGPRGRVTFGSAVDEALWKSARGELDQATEQAVIDATKSSLDFENFSTEIAINAAAIWEVNPTADITISNGAIAVDDGVRDQLRRAITDGKTSKAKLGRVTFDLPSGSQAFNDWHEIDPATALRNYRPRAKRPRGDVFSPYVQAASTVDFERSGWMIDQALNAKYRDIWDVPGGWAGKLAELQPMSKIARLGDEGQAFADILLERFRAEHPDVDPYHSLLYTLDGLVEGRPDVMALYGDIGTTQSGQRFLDWLRTGDNWDILKENWHTNSPHFGMNRMPNELFKLVGTQGEGKRGITNLALLDDYINDPAKAVSELRDRLNSLELEEIELWLDGMHARWNDEITDGATGVVTRRRDKFIDSPRGARQVAWKPNVHADDFDEVMYPESFGQIYDQDAFTANVATSIAELEAKRLGFDPSQIDFWMQMMASVKGNLGFFWLGIPPRYLVNNTMGNIMSEFLLGVNPGSKSGLPFMPMPAVVKKYWRRDGGHFPRLLSNVFQSEYSEQFLQLSGPERRGSVRRGRLGGRSVSEARALRQVEDEASGFLVPRAARWIDKNTIGRLAPDVAGGPAGITLWTDGMAWLNESSELNFRRRIYAKELWGHYKIGWGQRIDSIAGLDPGVRETLRGQLSAQDVMATLTTEVSDPRLRAVIMNRHSASMADAHHMAYDWTRKALRDYRMRTNFDYVLDRLFPYHFWTTKNLLFAGSTLADRPSVLLNIYRQYDKLAEQWEDLPPSFKNTLYLFTMPELALAEAAGLDLAGVFVRPNNISNPALFTMALTAEGFRDAWKNQDENTSIKDKLWNTAIGGADAFAQTSGYRVGPQYGYVPFVLNREDVQRDSQKPENSIYGEIVDAWQYAAEPNGYRPSVVPLGGLETIAFGFTDAALEKAGAPANMRVMRGVEWAQQQIFGTPLSKQDGMLVGYQMEAMVLDGYFGDVTVEENEDGQRIVTEVSREALLGYGEALQALRSGNLDHPAVREALNRDYKNDLATAVFNVLGAPFKFYSTEWRETTELQQENNRIHDTYGRDAAVTWRLGTYNPQTGMYENPKGMRLYLHWWATDNAFDGETIDDVIGELQAYGSFGNIGPEYRVNRVSEQQQRRAENEEFYAAAKPFYADLNGIGQKYDRDIQQAVEDGDMVLADILDRQARRAKAGVFARAEDAGVELTRDYGIPLFKSTWWRSESGGGKQVANLDSPSMQAEQDLARNQTEYAMDMVIQQLGLELYDPETGEYRTEFMTFDEDQQRLVFDQQKYDSHIKEMLPVAQETYREYVKWMAGNEGLIRADLSISADDFASYMNENVIPELEDWRGRRDTAYAEVANITDRDEREAAIEEHRQEFGQDFYRTSPNQRYVMDSLAGTIAENYDQFTIAQQKVFRDQFPELFDEHGMLNANGLKPDTVLQIARDYGMELPTSEEELEGVADAALRIQNLWYQQMHPDQKGEWFKTYGDPESAFYIPGLITEEARRDPETGEMYTSLAINREAMTPAVVNQVMQDWGISIDSMEHRGGTVRFARAPDLLEEANTKKEMDNRLGEFWAGAGYLNEEEVERAEMFQSFLHDDAAGHEELEASAQDLKDRVAAELGQEYISWADFAPFVQDPQLREYVDRRIRLAEKLGMNEIYDKRSDYLRFTEAGQELLQFFPEEEFLQTAAHWGDDDPTLRSLKDRFHAGELWLQGDPEALARWQAWETFTGGENSDIERYVNQLRDDMDKPTWKQMVQIVGEDVEIGGRNVREYLQARLDTFAELDVGNLYQRRGQWMVTGPGQGLYRLDTEYFDFYLPNPDDILRGGVSSSSGYKSSGTSGSTSGRSYGSSSGSYYSGRRQSGFARSAIDDYQDIAREVFFMDTAMVSGQAADSEQRMGYAQRVADRLQELVTLVSGPLFQSGETSNLILPFISILMDNIRRRLGEEPTLESWLDVLRWLGLEGPEAGPIPDSEPGDNETAVAAD